MDQEFDGLQFEIFSSQKENKLSHSLVRHMGNLCNGRYKNNDKQKRNRNEGR